jgi:hypothetical protein
MKVVVASAILGAAAIFSAAMVSGNLDFKQKNIVNTDNGHVNLGKVYSESALVDVELRFIDDQNTLVFDLKGLPYQSYKNKIDDQFQSMIDDYNKNKPDDKKLTVETLSFKVPSKLKITAHTSYRTENIPVYELILDEKTVNFDKDINAHKTVMDAVDHFVTGKISLYKSTFFIADKK